MTRRKPKLPANVVSLADYRQSSAATDHCGPDALKNTRLVAWLASYLGVDLRLVAAVQRGDIPPVA